MKFLASRWLTLFVVATTLLCALFILQFTKFPNELPRLYIFDYLLRQEDLPGAAVVIAIALAAALPAIARPALALVDAITPRRRRTARPRRPRRARACALSPFFFFGPSLSHTEKNPPLAADEHLILMQ